jgi:hypothetical protein
LSPIAPLRPVLPGALRSALGRFTADVKLVCFDTALAANSARWRGSSLLGDAR